MKTLALIACCLVLTAVLPCAAELPAEMSQAFEQYSALPDTLAPLLHEVQDKASADTAAPKLHAQLAAIVSARDALQVAEKMTDEQKAEVQERYALRMRKQWGRVYDEMFRITRAQCYRSAAFTKEFGNMNMLLSQ